MKKIIILSVTFLILIGVGYFIYSYRVSRSNPCSDIFEQTLISLKGKISTLKEKGESVLDGEQIKKVSDQSEQIAADLKACCILFNANKIDFDRF